MALTTAAIENRPACNQKLRRLSGAARATSTAAARRTQRSNRTIAALDTGDHLAAEEPRRADEQDDEHDRVRGDLRQVASQEEQVFLVPGGQGGHDADEQPAHHGPREGVEAA